MAVGTEEGALYRGLLGDDAASQLFSDREELRAMLQVEGTLAQVQGDMGVIPAEAGHWLGRICSDIQIDPADLAAATAVNGVPVPALVDAVRRTCDASPHAQFLHWGATSQDIMDTALMLRLKPLLALLEDRLDALLAALAAQARRHATLAVVARTYGQIAAPTSFGAMVAAWGRPLLRLQDRLAELRPRLLVVQLGGAVGTLSVLGDRGPAVRAALAQALGLGDPGASWHAERDRIAELAAWLAALSASLGKMGEDIGLMAQSGIAELRLAGGGVSSTMPHKANPVQPAVLVALARHATGLNTTLQSAVLHRQNRDGAAWFTEWMALPPLGVAAARAVSLARDLALGLRPDAEAMRPDRLDPLGLCHAEAITFALAAQMPRPDAQAAVGQLCARAAAEARSLPVLAAELWPRIDWAGTLSADATLGSAPKDAAAFAALVQSRRRRDA